MEPPGTGLAAPNGAGRAGRMAISAEMRARIRRLHRAEGWAAGTIARQLGIHHSTVRRALGGEAPKPAARRRRMIDPYVPFIKETLEEHPDLSASVLYRMVCRRGYRGGPDHFRHVLAPLRPRRRAEARMRVRVLPGEQAQVDWMEVAKVPVENHVRKLMGFVMTLSHSRRIFVRFYYGAGMSFFLHGHVCAFNAFGGVPRQLLYDNLKSAVVARRHVLARYNDTLLELAGHYGFQPGATMPRAPHQKGRVERSAGYVRESCLAGHDPSLPIDRLNRIAEEWCDGPSLRRRWPQDDGITVAEAFEAEKRFLLPLPASDFPCEEVLPVSIGRTPYARFDTNDYSVPHQHVRRTLTVCAGVDAVRILDGGEVVASHARSYGRRLQIEDERHIDELAKSTARRRRPQDRLIALAPATGELMAAAGAGGDRIDIVARHLERLLALHGADELEAAARQAVLAGSPHPNAVRRILDRRRRLRNLPPPLPAAEPEDGPSGRTLLPATNLAAWDGIGKGEST